MQIFNELNYNPDLSLALGFFDGVHIGHKAVIENAVQYANHNNKQSAVITFKDHPCCYFWGVCPKYILTREQREKFISDLGVDYLYALDFNEDLSKISAEQYLKDILIKNFKPSAISTGFNHNFGANKSGNTKFLKTNQTKYGYKYFEIQPQKIRENIISSTNIRNYLSEGKIEEANQMLGYNFIIRGKVIEGAKLGRQIGFPTANLNYPCELIDLPFGVYAVKVLIENKYYKGIANFGIKPTVSNTCKHGLEVHILDFDKDIYGENIIVEFLKMIRAEQKFSDIKTLKEQIQKDIISIL